VRIRLAWYWWRQTCTVAGVALSRILLSASHSDVSVARQRPQRVGLRAPKGGARAVPASLRHPNLLSGDDPHSISSRRRIASTLRELREANERLLDTAVFTRDKVRALVADAYTFEALASQSLVGDSSWEVHFQVQPISTPAQAYRPPPTPSRARPQHRSVTPQSARSVAYFRSLTARQDAIEQKVINPSVPSVTGTPAHVKAARNVLRRAGAALSLPSSSDANPHPGSTMAATPRRSTARGLTFTPNAIAVEANIPPLSPSAAVACTVACTEATQQPERVMTAPEHSALEGSTDTSSAEGVAQGSQGGHTRSAPEGVCSSGGSRLTGEAARVPRAWHAGSKRARADSERVSTPRRSRRLETLYGTGDDSQYAE